MLGPGGISNAPKYFMLQKLGYVPVVTNLLALAQSIPLFFLFFFGGKSMSKDSVVERIFRLFQVSLNCSYDYFDRLLTKLGCTLQARMQTLNALHVALSV